MAKYRLERKWPRIALRRSMLTRTSGGSSETEENELTVIPCGRASASSTVTTVIPVAKRAQVRR